jgi:hypothetical protein
LCSARGLDLINIVPKIRRKILIRSERRNVTNSKFANGSCVSGIAGPRGRPGKGGQDGTPGLPGISAWMVNGAKANELLIPPSIAGEYYFLLTFPLFSI